MKRYVALVHHEAGSAYGVSFPDFPGCVSAGDTFDEAISNAVEALWAHVDLMHEDGDVIPEPRDLQDIRAAKQDWVDFDNAVVTLVPLMQPAGKPMRLNISLDEELVKTIDLAAANRGMTRSGFLADAARRVIQERL